ncbi:MULTISPECIES: hypothetical protein [Actinosynnema]|uniref:hypothetical protein n=1 Tax=Actinosynnema TaxID=40566 RepID=UPI0020A2E264|nr:hypothetical protein [Actinosynnema pretiosum]
MNAELDAVLHRIDCLTARAHECGDTATPSQGPEPEPVFTTWRDLLREGRERLADRVWLSPCWRRAPPRWQRRHRGSDVP